MPITVQEADHEIEELIREVESTKQRLTEARKRRPKEHVQDYLFEDSGGKEVRLSELFGDKTDLIVVHNMGTSCSYCTLWADGFVSVLPHLEDRAAFAVCSPNTPDVQSRFAAQRGWSFKMISCSKNEFARDMGFWEDGGTYPGPQPGVSTFTREVDGSIYRVAKAPFGPGDDFCVVWPFLDLLQNGANDWEPQYNYNRH